LTIGQDWACGAATPMKSASDSESTDVLMSIAKHSVTTKDRRQCQSVTASAACISVAGVEMRDITDSSVCSDGQSLPFVECHVCLRPDILNADDLNNLPVHLIDSDDIEIHDWLSRLLEMIQRHAKSLPARPGTQADRR
jgi:hypothetical protein